MKLHFGLVFLLCAVAAATAFKFNAIETQEEDLIHELDSMLNEIPSTQVGDDEAIAAPGADLKSGLQGACTCKQLIVSSLGETQHIQPDSLGIFKYYSMYNGYPSYYGPKGRRLYFLAGSGWLVGASLGGGSGYVHNGASYQCPYLIPNGWQYVNHGAWYQDVSLVVRCVA